MRLGMRVRTREKIRRPIRDSCGAARPCAVRQPLANGLGPEVHDCRRPQPQTHHASRGPATLYVAALVKAILRGDPWQIVVELAHLHSTDDVNRIAAHFPSLANLLSDNQLNP